MEQPPLSTFSVQRRLRESDRRGGAGVTKREFADFMIDGKSLLDLTGGDYMSCFVRGFGRQNEAAKAALLAASDFISLLLCPECGDIGCGAVQTRVIRQGDDVVWDRLRWENAISDPVYDGQRQAFADKQLGPFRFEASAYEAAIRVASRI